MGINALGLLKGGIGEFTSFGSTVEEKETQRLITSLVTQRDENEWLEFKHNNDKPDDIGEYVSALSNAAALLGKEKAYMVWGVKDGTREILGTTFDPIIAKVNAQELENWLLTHLEPQIEFHFHKTIYSEKNVVLLEISATLNRPVAFKGTEYIRVGSYKKELRRHPEKERALWRRFEKRSFEARVALDNVSTEDVLSLLDYPEFFRLTRQPMPENKSTILRKMSEDKLLYNGEDGRVAISNLGAILFARLLSDFGDLARRGLRVAFYDGRDRSATLRQQIGQRGYAVGFAGALDWINVRLPANEPIKGALREEVRLYPEIAIREMLANALIHQDFGIIGNPPKVEVFTDRIEFSNPGRPLPPDLYIGVSPMTRNLSIASLMRRIGYCEEFGTGFTKVASSIETFQLPPLDFRISDLNTTIILSAPRSFSEMDREERIRACYQHACLLNVSGKKMTNTTLRQRLGIKESNYPQASKIISDSIDAGLIKPSKVGMGPNSTYIPKWA